MRTIKEMQASLLYIMLLTPILTMPIIARAGKGRHHYHLNGHHHSSGYNFIYSQPRFMTILLISWWALLVPETWIL